MTFDVFSSVRYPCEKNIKGRDQLNSPKIINSIRFLRQMAHHKDAPFIWNIIFTSTRAQLGEASFQAYWTEGRAMKMQEAIEYALKRSSD